MNILPQLFHGVNEISKIPYIRKTVRIYHTVSQNLLSIFQITIFFSPIFFLLALSSYEQRMP